MVEREFPEVVLVRNAENLGFARANNQASRKRGSYLFFLTMTQSFRKRLLSGSSTSHELIRKQASSAHASAMPWAGHRSAIGWNPRWRFSYTAPPCCAGLACCAAPITATGAVISTRKRPVP